MERCYDWNSNTLKFSDKNGNTFNLKFRGDKTIVSGDSATGKTYIRTSLENIIKDKNSLLKPYSADNVFILTEDNSDKIKLHEGRLVVIDRAEYILNEEIVNFINNDRKNRYLIFLRKAMGIEISPNHFAELKRDDGTKETVLDYQFDIQGWY